MGAGSVTLLILLATCQLDKLTNSPAPIAMLEVAPVRVLDTAALGSDAVRTATLALANAGEGTLSWRARVMRDAPWLVLSAGSGIAPAKVSISLDPGGLAVGVYHDTVLVSAENAAGSPAFVPVELVVVAGTAIQSTLTATSPITAGSGTSTITVTAQNAPGNPIAGATVLLTATGGGNTLTQPVGPTNASGVATGTLRSTVAESKIVSATINGVTVTQTATVVVTVGPVSAAQSTVDATSPITASSGSSQSTITVRARDGSANPIAGATVLLAATGAGNTLTQPVGPTNASGVVTGTLSSTVPGTKTVTATVGASVTVSQTAAVTVGNAAAASIAMSAGNAQTATAGTTVAVAPSVIVRDQFDNPVAGVAVTFAVASGGGSVSPTTAVLTNASGIAAVTSWTLGASAGSNALTATAGTLAGSPVTFTAVGTPWAPSASQSLVAASPTTITTSAGTSVATITVTVRDANGRPLSGATVTLAATGSGNTLTQPLGTTNATGQITGTLSSTAGGTKTVTATVNGAVVITQTAAVAVVAAATQLAFTVQPSDAIAGSPIAPAVKVTARNAQGNTATSFTGDVTVTLVENPAGGTLSGTTTRAAVAGVATFADLSVDKADNDEYRLGASAAGLSSATSAEFRIEVLELVFTVEPSDATAGFPIAPAVKITARDADGHTATSFTGDVTVTLVENPGGGTLSGTTTRAAVAGVATFADLSVDKADNDEYRLGASAAGLSSATSADFRIEDAELVFTVQPTSTAVGAAITPAVRVTVRDKQKNTLTNFTGNVTVAISTHPSGGTLSGTTTVAAANGVATFSTLRINRGGNGYRLTAAATAATGATSSAFNVWSGGDDDDGDGGQ